MLRLPFLALLTAALAACQGGGDDTSSGDDTAGDPDAQPPGGDGGPESGQWTYDEYDVTGGDCDVASQLNSDGGFLLSNHGDGTFTITPGDGTDPFLCTLDGGDFDCPDRATESFSDPTLDARLDGQARADGTFSDATHGAGVQTVDVTCTGADCGTIELALGADFPCTFTASFDIAKVGP
jgi:hypothetical protein